MHTSIRAGARVASIFGLALTFVASSFAQSGSFISVRTYGALGNGSHDDTTAFKKALAAKKNVQVPAGNYIIKDTLWMQDYQYFKMDPAATLTFRSTTAGASLIRVSSASYVTIEGGILAGDKATRPTGAHNGISIFGNSHDIKVLNTSIKNFPSDNATTPVNYGDGIYVGAPTSAGAVPSAVTFTGVKMDGNVRSGISVTAGSNILISGVTVMNGVMNAVNFEPNSLSDVCTNITIKGSTIAGYPIGINVVKGSNNVTISGNAVTASTDEKGSACIKLNEPSYNVAADTNSVVGGYAGIVTTATNTKILNNKVQSSRIGLWLSSPSPVVTGNTVTSCWENGLKNQATGSYIDSNTFADCVDPVRLANLGVTYSYAVQLVDTYLNGTLSNTTVTDSRGPNSAIGYIRVPNATRGGSTWTIFGNLVNGYAFN